MGSEEAAHERGAGIYAQASGRRAEYFCALSICQREGAAGTFRARGNRTLRCPAPPRARRCARRARRRRARGACPRCDAGISARGRSAWRRSGRGRRAARRAISPRRTCSALYGVAAREFAGLRPGRAALRHAAARGVADDRRRPFPRATPRRSSPRWSGTARARPSSSKAGASRQAPDLARRIAEAGPHDRQSFHSHAVGRFWAAGPWTARRESTTCSEAIGERSGLEPVGFRAARRDGERLRALAPSGSVCR